MGCDFSGVVVETNSSILSKGQKVAGFVHGSKFEDRGAFADHLKVDADRVVVIPDGISEEAAPTLGIPYMTAAMVSPSLHSEDMLAHAYERLYSMTRRIHGLLQKSTAG